MANSTSSNVSRSPIVDVESSAAVATAATENQCVMRLLFAIDVDGGKRIADRWLWTLVEDRTRWESFPWGIFVSDIGYIFEGGPTEVSAGEPSYHFYGNIYAIMIWAGEAIPSLGSKCGTILGASFIQRPRCTRWKLKKLGHVAFTTFFNDEIDCFEVLSSTPEEEHEPYMLSICDNASEHVQYTHMMPLFKKWVVGRGKEKGKRRARDGDSSVKERIVRQRTSGPVIFDPPYLITGCESSAEPHEPTCRCMEELLGHGVPLATPQWDLRGLDDFMSGFPHDGSVPTEPRVAQTESIPTADVDRASSPTEHTEGVHSSSRAVVPMLVTPPEIVPKTRQSSSSADLIPIPFEYSSVASRADTYHSHKLQYRSYRPHSPFSGTVVRKRKDLDEEAYCRWLDSNERMDPN
ncbi:hypothetical protein OROGR_006244 [Orobanche gracilis]